MVLIVSCLATLFASALLLGSSVGPLLGMRTGEQTAMPWLQAHRLYRGAAGFVSVLEPFTLLAAAVMTVLLRDWRPALLAALGGTACLTVSYLLYLGITQRANLQIVQWLPQTPPADWESWRKKWEVSQRVRFGLHGTGFALLALSTLISPLTQE